MTFRNADRVARGILFHCLAVAGLVGAAWAEEPQVRYCFNDWPPYAMMTDGEAGGISVEILREATKRAGMKANFVELPWKRCLEMVRRGSLDAVIDAAERPDFRQGEVSFSYYTNTFWVREDFPIDSLDFTALAGKTIGVIDGYVYPDALMEDIGRAGMRIETSIDDGTNIRKLAFGRVDSIIGDYVATLRFAEENGLALKPLAPTHSADRLYPSFNKDRADLHKQIDERLAGMMADGTIEAIYRRYLGKSLDDIWPE